MRALLIRTGSVPVHPNSFPTASLSPSLSSTKTLSLHLLEPSPVNNLRRATSDPDLGRSFSGGGGGKGKRIGGGGGGGGRDRRSIGEYYEEMVRVNPGDALLLGNYAKFLHQVVGDTIKAGEYYGRAILANPSDGEILSLYGKLIWETEKDGERAKAYFDRALHASPKDSTVLGLYAYFMWEAEEDEDDKERKCAMLPQLVDAY